LRADGCAVAAAVLFPSNRPKSSPPPPRGEVCRARLCRAGLAPARVQARRCPLCAISALLLVVAVVLLLVLDVVEGLLGVGRLDAGLPSEERFAMYWTTRRTLAIDIKACISRLVADINLRSITSLAVRALCRR
jgi:hypothetical protein